MRLADEKRKLLPGLRIMLIKRFGFKTIGISVALADRFRDQGHSLNTGFGCQRVFRALPDSNKSQISA